MKYQMILPIMIGYIFLYIYYNVIITMLHSSFSIVSVPAIVIPYIVLLFVAFRIWNGTDESKRKKVKKQLIALIIIATIPVVYSGTQLAIHESQSRFSPEKWQKYEHERVYMVDHLLKKYSITDMKKEEVINLLGEPTEGAYFKESNNIVYYLGPERGIISIDSEWLVISFDEQDRVIENKIVRD